MEKNQGNNIRLGLFVSLAIAAFIAGIYFIGERQQLFNSSFHIYGVFNNIDGLLTGNNVRFSGINIGVVGNIRQVTDSTVSVEMVINDKSRKFIKRNASAVIGTDGLMGNKIVTLVPGPPGQPQVADDAVVATIKPVSMDEIMQKIKTTADNAADISEDLAAIMNNISNGRGTIGKLFMDTTFATNLDRTVVNIRQGAGGFKKNMDAASHSFLLRGFLKRKKDKKEEKSKE